MICSEGPIRRLEGYQKVQLEEQKLGGGLDSCGFHGTVKLWQLAKRALELLVPLYLVQLSSLPDKRLSVRRN
jgi:hypothetical protein